VVAAAARRVESAVARWRYFELHRTRAVQIPQAGILKACTPVLVGSGSQMDTALIYTKMVYTKARASHLPSPHPLKL
jgi:hypothetical protein